MKTAIAVILVSFCSIAVAAEHADQIVIVKHDRKMTLMSNGREIHSYKVALGGQPVGAKSKQGDHKTPEGTYTIDSRNPHSQFYKSLHISYPNREDSKRARVAGV